MHHAQGREREGAEEIEWKNNREKLKGTSIKHTGKEKKKKISVGQAIHVGGIDQWRKERGGRVTLIAVLNRVIEQKSAGGDVCAARETEGHMAERVSESSSATHKN